MYRFVIGGLLMLLLSACSALSERAVMSDWQPVANLPSEPRVAVATPSTSFLVTPLDGSLRHLLARWAYLEGVQVDYRLSVDWQLHTRAAAVKAADLPSALSALQSAYAEQGISLRLDKGLLIAESVSVAQ